MTIAIIINKPQLAYSETFIKMPMDLLPARVVVGVANRQADPNVLSALLARSEVDVALAFYGPTGVAALPSCIRTRTPLAVRFAGYDAFDERVLPRYAAQYRDLFGYAAAAIAVSRPMFNRLKELGAREEQLHLCPSGANTEIFYGAHPEFAPPHFLSVGRFVDKKAPYLTLLAFERVLREMPNVTLQFVGDGPLLEACLQMSLALGIENAVTFSGVKTQADIATIMRSCRAYVQHSLRTSYGDGEGTPNSVMEAGASGLPTVTTRHGGIPDVVLDCQTGFLVDERDIICMAERMIKLADDPRLAASLGAAAQARIRTMYSADISVRHLFEILTRCLVSRSIE